MAILDRVQLLRDFISEEPENPFNYYALALELREKDLQETAALFDFLLREHVDYLPVYFPSAHYFAELGAIQKAGQIFANGILLATNLSDEKTLKELKNAYQNFLFENDLD